MNEHNIFIDNEMVTYDDADGKHKTMTRKWSLG